jgi:hypothetical protein
MRKYLILSTMIISGLIFYSFTQKPNENVQTTDESAAFTVPTDVQKALDKACTGCHSNDASNAKAKMKWKVEDLSTMKTYKLAGKLSDMAKEINEDKMPPSKFVEKYPEHKLTNEEKTLLVNWATKESEKLAE